MQLMLKCQTLLSVGSIRIRSSFTGKLKPEDKVIEYLILPPKKLIQSLSQREKRKESRQTERKN